MPRTHQLRTAAAISRQISYAAVAVLCLAGGNMAAAEGPTIVLINPNSNAAATESMTALAQEAAGEKARIVGRTNDAAPRLLTTPEDMIQATNGVVEIGRQAAESDGSVAFIISAFSDPGLAELREALPDAIVVGIGEEAFHEAARDGRLFAIVTITPDPALIESFQARADLGYAEQYKGVRVTPGDPKELVEKPEQLDAALAKAVEKAISEDGAEAVIMGGGPLSAPAMRIQPRFDVPLVVAVTAATNAALKKLAR